MKRILLFVLISLFTFNAQSQTRRPKERRASPGQSANKPAHSKGQSGDRWAHSKGQSGDRWAHSKGQSADRSAHSKGQSADKSAHSKGQSADKPTHSKGQSADKPAHSKGQSTNKPAHSKGQSADRSAHSKGQSANKPAHSKGQSGDRWAHSKGQSGDRSAHSKGQSANKPAHSKGQSGDRWAHSKGQSGDRWAHSKGQSGDRSAHSKDQSADKPTHSKGQSADKPAHSKGQSGDRWAHSKGQSANKSAHSKGLSADRSAHSKGQSGDRSAHSKGQSANKSAHYGELRRNNRSKSRVSGPHSQLPVPNSSLLIRRVILYSNGVAYIERRGIVSGHAEVSLSFKQSQVDDVLKSMLVLDLGKGRIGAVSYNSSAPASARMAEIPFAISASSESTEGQSSGGLAGVLSQLQGARVVVATASRTVTGRIITVEARRSSMAQVDANKPAVTSHRLVIASDNGQLSSFDLAEVRSIQLADEGARRDLNEFAHAAASARRRDAKTIVVTSDGAGQRELVVSYTIAAPIWKTTYRVVLDSTGQPFFQGWALVDNVSDEDWTGIELSLVSGTPISFIQPIQNPVYRYRPVIPLPQDLNLKPQVYEPAHNGGGSVGSLSGRITDPSGADVPNVSIVLTNSMTNQSVEVTTDNEGRYEAPNLLSGQYSLSASASGFQQYVIRDINIVPGLRSKLDFRLEVGNVSATVNVTAGVSSNNYSLDATESVSVSRPALNILIAQHASGVEAETTASEIGDLFEYHIDQPVTVPRDRSALIPILQTRMSGERVSIYRSSGADVSERVPSRPRSGLLLKNTSRLTLEDGSLTVLDGDAYAGEALLERLKPAEERLVSFALDLGTLVNVETRSSGEPVHLVRAVRGVIHAHRYTTQEKRYTLVNQTDRARIVYLEHPIDEDGHWELADDTPKPEVKTAKHYRFRVKLEPHQRVEFPVKERKDLTESYALTSFGRKELELFIERKYIDEPARIALQKIIELKDRVTAADVRLQQINKEATEIAADQLRLRENIKALTSTAEARQLIARYVSKANDQETRLEQIEKDRIALVDERTRLQVELDLAIRSLSLDHKIS